MGESDQQPESQTLAFLKVWTESWSKLGQAAFSISPEAAPPDLLRQIRAGMFQALAQSWDEFLRSPQFMQSMKEMMNNAMAFRKLSTDLLAKARSELGAVDQEDVYGLILAIRQSESRLLERMEALSSQIVVLNQRLGTLEASLAKPTTTSKAAQPRSQRRRPSKSRQPQAPAS